METRPNIEVIVIEDAIDAFERNTNRDYQESKRIALPTGTSVRRSIIVVVVVVVVIILFFSSSNIPRDVDVDVDDPGDNFCYSTVDWN